MRKHLLFGAAIVFLAVAAPPLSAQFGQNVIRDSVAVCDPSSPNTCITIGAIARIQSAATTNATSVKASSTNVLICNVGNNGAGAAYLKLYNKASAPTVGTDTPVFTLMIPIGGVNDTYPGNLGLTLSTGFAYAITGGAADSDTTAVAANQVVGFCAYK